MYTGREAVRLFERLLRRSFSVGETGILHPSTCQALYHHAAIFDKSTRIVSGDTPSGFFQQAFCEWPCLALRQTKSSQDLDTAMYRSGTKRSYYAGSRQDHRWQELQQKKTLATLALPGTLGLGLWASCNICVHHIPNRPWHMATDVIDSLMELSYLFDFSLLCFTSNTSS